MEKHHVKITRQKWFGCACCPPNAARLLSSLAGYAYEQREREVFINQFVCGDMEVAPGGEENHIQVETGYPWDGDVHITVRNKENSSFTLSVRVPGWCEHWSITVNGQIAEGQIEKGYFQIDREWADGDQVLFSMEMPVKLIAANPKVREDIGKVAVMRGPLVYCLEEADNGDLLPELYLKGKPEFILNYEDDLLGGVTTLTTEGLRLSEDGWSEKDLYRPYAVREFHSQTLKFIPYYAWANRNEGEMLVWVKIKD